MGNKSYKIEKPKSNQADSSSKTKRHIMKILPIAAENDESSHSVYEAKIDITAADVESIANQITEIRKSAETVSHGYCEICKASYGSESTRLRPTLLNIYSDGKDIRDVIKQSIPPAACYTAKLTHYKLILCKIREGPELVEELVEILKQQSPYCMQQKQASENRATVYNELSKSAFESLQIFVRINFNEGNEDSFQQWKDNFIDLKSKRNVLMTQLSILNAHSIVPGLEVPINAKRIKIIEHISSIDKKLKELENLIVDKCSIENSAVKEAIDWLYVLENQLSHMSIYLTYISAVWFTLANIFMNLSISKHLLAQTYMEVIMDPDDILNPKELIVFTGEVTEDFIRRVDVVAIAFNDFINEINSTTYVAIPLPE